MPELTAPQIATGSIEFDGGLPKTVRDSATWYKKVRVMRKQPTVKLARSLAGAVLMSAKWSVETKDNAPDGAKDFIRDQLFPIRSHLLGTGYKGCSDFGWQPYEKVFTVRNGIVVIDKVKPLLQDLTTIQVIQQTGAFNGFKNQGPTQDVDVPLPNALLLNLEVEGTDWYGISDMEAVELPYDNWVTTNGANIKYDKKLAGAHWIIYYPTGTSEINGKKTDNFEIAKSLLNMLESSGSFVVPKVIDKAIDDLNKNQKAWEIELKTCDASTGAGFIERMNYLDKMFCRAIGIPERAMIEGQFGTKAEAGEHGDFAITNIELRHQILIQQLNWHLVNQLLRFNYGEQFENTVYLAVAPLVDVAREILRKVYETVLANPDGLAEEMDNIDKRSLREKLGIPTLTVADRNAQDDDDAALAEDATNNLLRSLAAA